MPDEAAPAPPAAPALDRKAGAGIGAPGTGAYGVGGALVEPETATSVVPAPPEGGGERPGIGRLLGVTSFAHFMNDGVVFFIPVVGDLLAQGHGTSTVVVTAMLTLFYVASAGFGIAVGLVADSVGRRTLMMGAGIATLGVSLLGFYASLSFGGIPSDVLVLLAAALAGIGSSFYHPLGGSVLQLNVPPSARGTALGINGAFGSLGRAAYPALFFVVAALGISKTDTTAVFGGISLLAAAVVAFGLPAGGKRTKGREAKRAEQENERAARSNHPTEAGKERPAQERRPLRSLMNRSVVALMAIAFFRSLAFIGAVSWIPIYLTAERHVGISSSLGTTVTVMYAGGILGQPLFGLLADRFDKRLMLALDSLGAAGGIFFFLGTSGDGASALTALAIFGLFTFSGFPLLLSLVADYVPKEASTTGNALVWGVGSTGGQALGPLAVSLITLGSKAHLAEAFGILGALAAATVLATPLLQKTARSARVALFG